MVIAIAVIFLIACQKDILVKDISGKTVSVLAPADGLSTQNNSITFWWEELDGAEKYNIQIASPSFTALQQLIADTNVAGTKFIAVLQPGTYQWRIKGINNGGSSDYLTRTLTIDTTSNLAFLTVALTSPADQYTTNQSQVTMSWTAIQAATLYNLKLTNTTLGTQVLDTTITGTSLARTLGQQGAYTWKVRAENNFSVTGYSQRTFTIDATAPNPPAFSYPADNAGISLGDSISWVRQSGALYDSLFISSDTSFSASSTFYQKIRETTSNTYYFITAVNGFTSAQNYYWRLKSVDAAGNVSVYSTRRKFHVN